MRMLGNITACQCLTMRLSQMQDAGIMADEHASLAKAYCTVKMRETVGYARELLGGNGILLDDQVGRLEPIRITPLKALGSQAYQLFG